MTWLLLLAPALAQEALSPEATNWLAGMGAAGAGLGAITAGAAAVYRYLLKPSVASDIEGAVAPLNARLETLERVRLETWGTAERGLLADLVRLADADLVRRLEAIESGDRAHADRYGQIVSNLDALHALLEER